MSPAPARIFSFKLSRDVSNRVFKPSGCNTAFHTASHHLDRDDRITEFQKINTYHVSLLPHLLDKLKATLRAIQPAICTHSVMVAVPTSASPV